TGARAIPRCHQATVERKGHRRSRLIANPARGPSRRPSGCRGVEPLVPTTRTLRKWCRSNYTLTRLRVQLTMIAERNLPIPRVVDLVKNYYMESVVVRALRGVTIDFEQGDFVALMGPSGSGKSTLLNLLGCLDRPTDGQYFLGDNDVSEMDDDDLSDVRSRYI